MAYDGLVIKSTIDILKKEFLYEHIKKINQNDNKKIELCIRKNNSDFFICISINPDFPNIILTKEKNSNIDNQKAFCMLLRKHLIGGTIIDIKQINNSHDDLEKKIKCSPSLERIVDFEIKNVNDMGDIVTYHLICELMGRYSNVLLCDDKYVIIDVLNKIYQNETTIRALEPKKMYNTDELEKKNEIYNITFNDFLKIVEKFNLENIDEIFIKKMMNSFYGMSKSFLLHILYLSENKNKDKIRLANNEENLKIFYDTLIDNIKMVEDGQITPYIFYEDNKPSDFHILSLSIYNKKVECNTITEMLTKFYEEKNSISFQNSLKNSLLTNIDSIIKKINKKIEFNENDIENSKDYENYKIYGELINTYGYDKLKIKNNVLRCINFYNGEEVEIKIEPEISISKNAEKYFNKYNKLKRKIEIANELLNKNKKYLSHAINIRENLSYTTKVEDLNFIKEEMDKYFISVNHDKHKKNVYSNKKIKMKVHHYISSAGIDIYVGMNNLQNEYLTFEFAKENDTWFHVKNATGSHVIVKGSYENLDIKTVEEAASLAGYFSSVKNENKVTVDYTLRKELKKVKGAPPGFCIYHKNYSINVKPEVSLKEIKQ